LPDESDFPSFDAGALSFGSLLHDTTASAATATSAIFPNFFIPFLLFNLLFLDGVNGLNGFYGIPLLLLCLDPEHNECPVSVTRHCHEYVVKKTFHSS
jgi:hypothetical protein